MEDQKLKEILIEKNPEFRKLFLKHQQYETDLNRIQQKTKPTDAELIEEQTIKKQKLKVKDAMQQIIFDFKEKLG